LALVPIPIASWALGGLYLSLGPSVSASIFGLSNHLVGGLVVTLLCGTGAITAFAVRSWPTARVLAMAAALLTGGTAVTLLGVQLGSIGIAAAGTVVAGVGFGASALGCFGTLARLAAPQERGELFAVVLVISYLAFSLPAMVAGLAATSVGLLATALVYGSVVVALGAITMIIQWRRRPARRSSTLSAAAEQG
jgi:hypothetical protein